MRIAVSGIVVCSAFILATPIVTRADPPSSSATGEKASVPASAAPAQTSQLRAYIDPETGRLVDHPVTAEQKRAAAQGMQLPNRGPVQEIHHADGSIEVVLNGAADSELIATVGKDGKVSVQCTDATHKLVPEGSQPQKEEVRDDH
ncbi:MAG: post-PEP-CTERM-1 domain-containing protein [Rudaea sp.]